VSELAFLATAAVLVAAGVRLARDADALGTRSALGCTLVGGALLAGVTSLPELVTGLGATAVHGLPDVGVGAALGSCVVNLVFVVAIDVAGPGLGARVDGGHRVAAGFGIAMLAVAGVGLAAGDALPAVGWVGLPSVVLVVLYAGAMRESWRERTAGPRSEAVVSCETPPRRAALGFVGSAAIVVAAGLVLPPLADRVAAHTGLGGTFVGSVFVAGTTSLPELVVSLAALRIGSPDLALANLLGSNVFNLFVLALEDLAYAEGPLLPAASPAHLASPLTAILMTAVVVIGLGGRESKRRSRATPIALIAAAVAYPFLLQAWPVRAG
jgi:cation:H+ antiporter